MGRDTDGLLPIHKAAREGQVAIVNFIIDIVREAATATDRVGLYNYDDVA